MNLKIQLLTLEHLSALLELDQACFQGWWSVNAYQHELTSPHSFMLGLFSPSYPSKLLGMACCWSVLEEAHITILAVHPEYQHQGLGQVLLYSLLKTADLRGLERVTLEVRVSNQAAISLYQKFGFKIAGNRQGYYQDNGEDALVLWLSLPKPPYFTPILANWRTMIGDRLSLLIWEWLD